MAQVTVIKCHSSQICIDLDIQCSLLIERGQPPPMLKNKGRIFYCSSINGCCLGLWWSLWL